MRRFYLPTRIKFFISLLVASIWAAFSVWMARFWANDLGSLVTRTVAWVIISFIAIIPGFLNINLVLSILLDWPPSLIFREKMPKVTVLIAAYNEEDSLSETIRGLRNQKYPGKFEVIIVDDGSTDRTVQKARELTKYLGGGLPCYKQIMVERQMLLTLESNMLKLPW